MTWKKLLLLTVLAVVLLFGFGFLMQTFGNTGGNNSQAIGKLLGTIVAILVIVVVVKRLLGR